MHTYYLVVYSSTKTSMQVIVTKAGSFITLLDGVSQSLNGQPSAPKYLIYHATPDNSIVVDVSHQSSYKPNDMITVYVKAIDLSVLKVGEYPVPSATDNDMVIKTESEGQSKLIGGIEIHKKLKEPAILFALEVNNEEYLSLTVTSNSI